MNQYEPELVVLMDEILLNPNKRGELFNKIGQAHLKQLDERPLEEKVYSILEYFCLKAENWKGSLMIPEFYKFNKTKNVPKDISYAIKEYFMWSVLYPSEADNYFNHHDNGDIIVVSNPKVRITSKDTVKDVYKSSIGKEKLVPVKLAPDFKIKSGFTVSQKSSILNACIVGLITIPEYLKAKKTVVKAVEKTVKKVKKTK